MTETVATPCFRQTLRVYWEDTDAGGVVFYANYLKFFERARTEWLRSLGFDQQRHAAKTAARCSSSPRQSVRYLRPARLDDLLDVTVTLRNAGPRIDEDRAADLAQHHGARRRVAGRQHDPHRLRRDAEPSSLGAFPARYCGRSNEPGHVDLHARAAGELRRADRDGGTVARLAGKLDGDLRQAVRAGTRAHASTTISSASSGRARA